MSAGLVHWHPPDPIGDVYREAFRPDAAPPREIRARSAIVREMREEEERRIAKAMTEGGAIAPYIAAGGFGPIWGCPVIVDDTLPADPGFEVHRIRPPGWEPAS